MDQGAVSQRTLSLTKIRAKAVTTPHLTTTPHNTQTHTHNSPRNTATHKKHHTDNTHANTDTVTQNRELKNTKNMCMRDVPCWIGANSNFEVGSCASQKTYHVAGSAREPIGHSISIRGGTRIQWCTSPQPPVLVRSCWKHNSHRIRQRAIETHFKYCDHQSVSSCCVRHCAFQAWRLH